MLKKAATLLAFFALSTASGAATPVYSKTYQVPGSSGIIWIVIDPTTTDGQNYRADININWGSYSRNFTFSKNGRGQIVIGMPHWYSDKANFTVTSNKIVFYSNAKATIYSIEQGNYPPASYPDTYRCGVNLSC
jgi:hypothetical protein